MTAISTAELAIYAALTLPILYLLIRHGLPGFFGWFYLLAFCSLRIIGGGLALANSSSASIVDNIGLSPLLLAASGILHESSVNYPAATELGEEFLLKNVYRKSYCSVTAANRIEVPLLAAYHMVVVGAVALLASGASSMEGQSPQTSGFDLVKAGISLLTVSWVALVFWAVITMFLVQVKQDKAGFLFRGGLKVTCLRQAC